MRVSSPYLFLCFEQIPIFSYFLDGTSYSSYILAGEAKITKFKMESYFYMLFTCRNRFYAKLAANWLGCSKLTKIYQVQSLLIGLLYKMGLTGLHDSPAHALALTSISSNVLPLLYNMKGGSWLVL